jgi:hypothetical protein
MHLMTVRKLLDLIHDGIPTRLLKETASVISPSLCKLYNKSLEQGIFPHDCMELTNIVPIYYKKGQREHTVQNVL